MWQWWITALITGAREFPSYFTRAIGEVRVSYYSPSCSDEGYHCCLGRKKMKVERVSLMRGLMSQHLRCLNLNLLKWPDFIPRVLSC